jgi:hypothetical protein
MGADGYERIDLVDGRTDRRRIRGRMVVDDFGGIRKPPVIGSTPIAGSIRKLNVERPPEMGAVFVYITGICCQCAATS